MPQLVISYLGKKLIINFNINQHWILHFNLNLKSYNQYENSI